MHSDDQVAVADGRAAHNSSNQTDSVSAIVPSVTAKRLLPEDSKDVRATSAPDRDELKSAPGEVRSPPPLAQFRRPHLQYLDGFRGLAALYIVFYHGAAVLFAKSQFFGFHYAKQVLERGAPLGVAVFIVLSGYCLMLPVTWAGAGEIPGGTWAYIKRRAKRILPAYYAALACSILLIAFVPAFGQFRGDWWDHALPALHWDNIVAHALLIHSLSGTRWATHINGPMWSVAVEWHIYFAFPFLLLPLVRRFGVVSMAFVAYALGIALYLLVGLQWERSWYLGLFAMGAAGAAIGFTDEARLRQFRKLPWGWVSAASWIVAIALWLGGDRCSYPAFVYDFFTGIATTATLIYCTRQITDGHASARKPLVRLFGCRAAVWVGAVSYSLYLTHAPILAAPTSFPAGLATHDPFNISSFWDWRRPLPFYSHGSFAGFSSVPSKIANKSLAPTNRRTKRSA